MKELHEIERDYIENIISFFCRKSMEVFGLKNNSRKNDITNFIGSCMVLVNIDNISDIRNYKIGKILGSDSSEPRNNIEVSIKYGTREIETFQYFIN